MMPETTDILTLSTDSKPPLVVLFGAMNDAFLESVVSRSLESRGRLPASVRADLDRALDRHVRAQGFRSASTAPLHRILKTICDRVKLSQDLAAPTLRAWCESMPDLRQAVREQLEQQGILTGETYSLPGTLELAFRRSPVAGALEACAENLPDSDKDEVALMVQLLAGKVVLSDMDGPPQGAEVEDVGRLLDDLLVALADLSPTAPEWDQAIPGFVSSLSSLMEDKDKERNIAASVADYLAEIQRERAELLLFFQCDIAAWSVDNIDANFSYQQVRDQAGQLEEMLTRYAPLHERAAAAAEELERARQRNELMPQVMEAAEALGLMFLDYESPEADSGQESENDTEPVCRSGSTNPVRAAQETKPAREQARAAASPTLFTALAPQTESPDETGAKIAAEIVPALSDLAVTTPARSEESFQGCDYIPACEIEFIRDLRSYVEDLEEDYEDLEHQNRGLMAQVKDLEQQLYESRTHQDSLRWAVAYRDNPAEPEDVPELESVAAAVELAKERYPGQLLFQLNAESEAEESAFKWPDQVWSALRWLAIDYFTSHLGDHPIPNIDEACREACGMWYKTSQHETTMTQFRESYTTRVGGRVIWLGEHIGKGNSFDPRRTIRIAFDWDRHLQKVVIGYIGQHQRTAAT